MSEEKLLARRQKIFAALDDMKEDNEKISAQKLAAKVSMGKQTVLPIYREWLEMESLTESEKVELSENLQQAIKREIAKEKFQLAERSRALQETIADKEFEITEKNEALFMLGQESEKKEAELEAKIAFLEERTTNQETLLAQKNEALHQAEKQQEIDAVTIASLKSQLKDMEKDKEKALKEQETQLDKAHQQLLDHWIQLVDTTRKEKQQLQQTLEKAREKEAEVHKFTITLEYQVNQLKDELVCTNNELDECKKVNIDLEQKQKQLYTLLTLLGNPEDVESYAKNLVEKSQTYEQLVRQVKTLNEKLDAAYKTIDAQVSVEKEVIKLKAYIKGLEQKHIN